MEDVTNQVEISMPGWIVTHEDGRVDEVKDIDLNSFMDSLYEKHPTRSPKYSIDWKNYAGPWKISSFKLCLLFSMFGIPLPSTFAVDIVAFQRVTTRYSPYLCRKQA